MTLILNNDEITQLLPMADCLDQLDAAYRDLGEGNAISRTRSDIYGPIHDNGRYVFKTMDGMVSRFEAAAVRLNSDVIRWGAGPGGIRKDKQRTAPGEKFVGLILLFSTRNGEPLAIMPDGVIQRLRVACTNALGAKYMAAPDASVYALIGSGWQASTHATAMALDPRQSACGRPASVAVHDDPDMAGDAWRGGRPQGGAHGGGSQASSPAGRYRGLLGTGC